MQSCLFCFFVPFLRAGSHFDISISTSINISVRKIRKIRVNRGYISISIRISILKHKEWSFFHQPRITEGKILAHRDTSYQFNAWGRH